MKFALFYEIPVPRPWKEDSELIAYENTLEQAIAGDRHGWHAFWTVEHHFLQEYSHCSNPEVLYGAIAARTERIRLGYGVRLMPKPYNHPVRTAESVAVLDRPERVPAEAVARDGLLQRVLVRVQLAIGFPRPRHRDLVEQRELHGRCSPLAGGRVPELVPGLDIGTAPISRDHPDAKESEVPRAWIGRPDLHRDRGRLGNRDRKSVV